MEETSLADTQGALFTLKRVFYKPEAPRANEPFEVTGDIDLFNFKYYPFLWVVVSVEYPKSLWQKILPILGTTTVRLTKVVFGGSFKFEFPEGFDGEGTYKLSVDVYGGPTTFISGITIPPFPPLVHYGKTFDVIGSILTETAFTLQPPLINGSPEYKDLVPNTDIALSFPVTSRSTSPVAVLLSVEVREAGTIISTGPLVAPIKNFDRVTLQPGETKNFALTYRDTGTPDKKRSIIQKLFVGSNLAPNTTPNNPYAWNDIYNITLNQTTDFQLEPPKINGSSAYKEITTGSNIDLSFPVTSRSTQPLTIYASVEIREAGTILGEGPLVTPLKSFTAVAIQPGETKSFDMTYKDTGTPDKKRSIVEKLWIGSQLAPNTKPNNPYAWNDLYNITKLPAGLAISYSDIVVLGGNKNYNLGQTAIFYDEITINSVTPKGEHVTVAVRIRENSLLGNGAWLSDLIYSGQDAYLLQPAISMAFPFNWVVGGSQGGKDIVLYVFADGIEIGQKPFNNAISCIIPRKLTVFINPAGAGAVVDEWGNPFESNKTYPDGTYVTLKIAPAYVTNFVNWTGDLSGQEGWAAPYITVQMTQDRKVYANFVGAVTPGTISFSIKPVNYTPDGAFWLIRHYNELGNRDFESPSGPINTMAVSSVSAGGHLEVWFANNYGEWIQKVVGLTSTLVDGKAYEWDIAANNLYEPTQPPPGNVTFWVQLAGVGAPEAVMWQIQWFDQNHNYVYHSDFVWLDTAMLVVPQVPPVGNIGVQLQDAYGNSLGTHYSGQFQAAHGSTYQFNYATSQIS